MAVVVSISEWSLKVPVILIMGVTTTLDAPRNILPSNVLQCLCPYKFTLGTPTERMDAVIEAVLVKQCSGFSVSHKVALFMRNYFVRQDGTLTSFIRALKVGNSNSYGFISIFISLYCCGFSQLSSGHDYICAGIKFKNVICR